MKKLIWKEGTSIGELVENNNRKYEDKNSSK